MATMILKNKKDQRYNDKIILVERRKGKFFMYAEIVLSIGLVLCLLWLVK